MAKKDKSPSSGNLTRGQKKVLSNLISSIEKLAAEVGSAPPAESMSILKGLAGLDVEAELVEDADYESL